MKLPRWLVIGMLTSSMLAVLVAAGWWWGTWPEQTAREFIQRLIDREVDANWQGMVADKGDIRNFELMCELWPPLDSGSVIEASSRSMLDLFTSYQCFFTRTERGAWSFCVVRGKVRSNVPESITIAMELIHGAIEHGKIKLGEDDKFGQLELELNGLPPLIFSSVPQSSDESQ